MEKLPKWEPTEVDELLENLTSPGSRVTSAESGHAYAVARPGTEYRHPVSWVLLGAALGVIGVVLGAVGVLVIQSITEDASTELAGQSVESDASTATTTAAVTVAANGGEVEGADTAPGVESTASTATVLESAPVTADNPAGAIRYLVVEGGEIHLRGLAPDRQVANNLVASVASWSRTTVVDEITISPAAPDETPVTVYVRDRVEFGSGQSDILAAEVPNIDLVARLLVANPALTVQLVTWVEGGSRLDAADAEHRYVIARAAAVHDQLVAGGVDPRRVVTDIGDEADLAESPGYDPARVIELMVEGTFPGRARPAVGPCALLGVPEGGGDDPASSDKLLPSIWGTDHRRPGRSTPPPIRRQAQT